MHLVVPIHSYIGEDTSLEVNRDQHDGKMYLIVKVDDGEVHSIDYGYRSIEEAKETAQEFTDDEVIVPKSEYVG